MTDQWELNRINFEGVWQGNSHWYVRRDDGELDFRQTTSVVSNTQRTENRLRQSCSSAKKVLGRGVFTADKETGGRELVTDQAAGPWLIAVDCAITDLCARCGNGNELQCPSER